MTEEHGSDRDLQARDRKHQRDALGWLLVGGLNLAIVGLLSEQFADAWRWLFFLLTGTAVLVIVGASLMLVLATLAILADQDN